MPEATSKGFTLFHASLNENTLEEKIDEVRPDLIAGDAQQNDQAFIERIDFEGNRRIRRDTLQARIFSRVGDPYNEETLRRDFQALWNTQFFEDVKLRSGRRGKAQRENHRFSSERAAGDPPDSLRRHPLDFRIGHSGSIQGEKSRAHGRKPVRSHAHQESGSGAEGIAGRTWPAVRDGDTGVRTDRVEQRGDPGVQDRRRAEGQGRENKIHREPRVQRPQTDSRDAPRPADRRFRCISPKSI